MALGPDVSDVAVVLPLYGNAPTLHELVRRCRAAVPGVRFVLVDDGCPRGSGAAADDVAATGDDVVVLRHDRNRGQQQAIRTGLAATGAAVSVVMDADLQDPPEAIPKLLSALAAHDVDAAFAGRRGAYEGPLRRLGGIAHRAVMAVTLGLPRDAGGFVAMTSGCVDAVLAMDGPPQLVAMIGRTGLPTTSVPVRRSQRLTGRSTVGTTARLRHAGRAVSHITRAWSTRLDPRDRNDHAP